ncbi:hypothetical protein EB810_11285 [Altererythrobacter sp. FM1]|uniref:hypothetical protein n=1 Tax=Tsuneonella flava TaxID=2055955 RepID=UPI000C7FAC0D|nr:hypothetical protein [Tsuneonella flava]ROT93717.1 hypothetical protein EB810_11285 [Altererythrobacter sp. FM1]
MTVSPRLLAYTAIALPLTLAGCATAPAEGSIRAALPAEAGSAAFAATDLAAAQDAYDAGDSAALTILLDRLRNRGVRPLDPDGEQTVDRWSQAATESGPPLRGRALGPGFLRGRLKPEELRATSQIFLAGKPTEISVAGGKGQPLRLRLLDAKANVVCERDPAYGRSCRFTPIFTQRYSIEIANRGANETSYYLVFD